MFSGPYVFQWFLEACRATAWCAAQADDFQKTLKNNCTRDHFARKRFYQKILKRDRAKYHPGAYKNNGFGEWCVRAHTLTNFWNNDASNLNLPPQWFWLFSVPWADRRRSLDTPLSLQK